MKLLIAVMSCWLAEKDGDNESVRQTWKKDVPANVDFRFFHGTGYSCYPGSDRKVCCEDVNDGVMLEDVVVLNTLLPISVPASDKSHVNVVMLSPFLD